MLKTYILDDIEALNVVLQNTAKSKMVPQNYKPRNFEDNWGEKREVRSAISPRTVNLLMTTMRCCLCTPQTLNTIFLLLLVNLLASPTLVVDLQSLFLMIATLYIYICVSQLSYYPYSLATNYIVTSEQKTIQKTDFWN